MTGFRSARRQSQAPIAPISSTWRPSRGTSRRTWFDEFQRSPPWRHPLLMAVRHFDAPDTPGTWPANDVPNRRITPAFLQTTVVAKGPALPLRAEQFLLAQMHDVAHRRRTEQPAVFAAELRRAFIADGRGHGPDVAALPQQ